MVRKLHTMQTERINRYLHGLAGALLDARPIPLISSTTVESPLPAVAGVYLLYEEGRPCYAAATDNLRQCIGALTVAKGHPLRRMVGFRALHARVGGKSLPRNAPFSAQLERVVTAYLLDNFEVRYLTTELGRAELASLLRSRYELRYCPLDSRPGTPDPGSPAPKSYTVAAKRIQYPNAYRPWDKEEEEELRYLMGQGKSTREIAEALGRNPGAIRSRWRKLGEG